MDKFDTLRIKTAEILEKSDFIIEEANADNIFSINFQNEIEAGVSKFVFTAIDDNYVVKIPFLTSVCCGSETCAYYTRCDCSRSGCYYCSHAVRSGDLKQMDDYCEIEANLYEKAKEQGIAKVFAETVSLGVVDDIPIYAQERVSSIGAREYTLSEEEYSTATKLTKDNYSFKKTRVQFILDVYNYYGDDFFNHFVHFLKENKINDLHSQNYGYREDGSPVIFDFSGYHD